MGATGIMESNEYYFAYSASLRIFGDGLEIDAISDTLGLQPTHVHHKGETRGNLPPYEHDMWSYRPTISENEDLQQHIDALWAALKPYKHYLLELKNRFTVDVFLGYRSDCETAGIEVPYTSLDMFTELQIPFGLSIIVT